MHNSNPTGVRTRSSALRGNASILSTSGLNTDGSAPPSMTVGRGTPPAASLSHNRADSAPQTLNAKAAPGSASAPVAAEAFRAIESSLVACCARCNIIFQRLPSTPTPCPLCHFAGASSSRLDHEFGAWRSTASHHDLQISDLVGGIKTIQSKLTAMEDNIASAEVSKLLKDMTATVEWNTLETKLAEIESFDISEFVALIDAKRGQLVETLDKFDSLNTSLKAITGKELNSTYSAAGLGQNRGSDTTSSRNAPCSFSPERIKGSVDLSVIHKRVLIAGDLNVAQVFRAASALLQNDQRVTVLANSEYKLENTVAGCKDWLRGASGPALVILHSGLRDVLLTQASQDNYEQVKSTICENIKRLSQICLEKNASLKVTSIPEIIDYADRRDYRQIAFDINVAIKKLSSELDFEFIDILAATKGMLNSFAKNGIHYNRNGQSLVGKCIADSISHWLGEPKKISAGLAEAERPRRHNSTNIPAHRPHLRFNSYGNKRLTELRKTRVQAPSYLHQRAGYIEPRNWPEPCPQYSSFKNSSRPAHSTLKEITHMDHGPLTLPQALLTHSSADTYSPRHTRGSTNLNKDGYLNPWQPGFEPWAGWSRV